MSHSRKPCGLSRRPRAAGLRRGAGWAGPPLWTPGTAPTWRSRQARSAQKCCCRGASGQRALRARRHPSQPFFSSASTPPTTPDISSLSPPGLPPASPLNWAMGSPTGPPSSCDSRPAPSGSWGLPAVAPAHPLQVSASPPARRKLKPAQAPGAPHSPLRLLSALSASTRHTQAPHTSPPTPC